MGVRIKLSRAGKPATHPNQHRSPYSFAGFRDILAGIGECGGPIGTRDYERKRENAWGVTQERLGGHILRACTLFNFSTHAWEVSADGFALS
jgi:hypothetical protein